MRSVEDEATKQEKRKTKEEVHGCSDSGYVGGWCRTLVDKKINKKNTTKLLVCDWPLVYMIQQQLKILKITFQNTVLFDCR